MLDGTRLRNCLILASTLMSDAGHNPTLEAIGRVTTTLEAMSAYALHPDGPTPGRLTNDVDPPGFESLASFIPGAGPKPRTESSTQVNIAKKSASAPTKKEKATQAAEASRLEKTRQAKIATAKVSLQAAKKSVKDAQAKVQRLEAAQKKADAESREAEKQRREAEQRYKRASIAAETATRRVQSMAEEVEEATNAFDDARRAVEEATSELELLFQVGP